MTDENTIARLRDVARQLERERDEARRIVRDLVAVMDAFNFDRAMREHHIAARHVREWGFDPPRHDTTSITAQEHNRRVARHAFDARPGL